MDSSYIARAEDAVLRAFLGRTEEYRPVLLVEGARQVGKTRLVEQALVGQPRRVVALNLEREALARAAIDACEEFAQFAELLADDYGFTGRADEVLFLDEAQESRRLGGFVRFMKEDWARATVILSGSTLTRLFRPEVRYPVGRVERLVVRPFRFSEYLLAMGQEGLAEVVRAGDPANVSPARHERLLEQYDGYLRTGGLPEAVLARARGEDDARVRERLLADYQQDFSRLFGEADLALVQACLRAVANFVGTPAKNTTVVPNASTAVNARINEIYQRLESWHLVLRSEQRGTSASASHGYHPKRYLFDTGLLRQLRSGAEPSLKLIEQRPDLRAALGGVIEHQLAVDLSRFSAQLTGWKRSAAGTEIDFLWQAADAAVPVESKASLHRDGRHLKGLRSYLDVYPVDLGCLVSLAPHQVTTFDDGKRVLWLPVYAAERLPELLEAALAG